MGQDEGSGIEQTGCKSVKEAKMKKSVDNIAWKISLFFKCVMMDIKNRRLEKKIEKKRKENERLKAELAEITGEVVL